MRLSDIPTPLQARNLAVTHGFFTRQGGVSTGPYAALNCSLSGRDSPESVLANRARAARSLGVAPNRLLGLSQVHGAAVVRVSEPWSSGNGPSADAMVTNRPGIGLGIVTADCAPILLCDPAAGVIGAAHAGWRGALAGVIEATVAAMMTLGATPQGLHAAIGPCIARSSYEVGADLREAILCRDPTAGRHFTPGKRDERWQFDLAGFCVARLGAAGVTRTEALDCDTLADEARFFSHRRRTLASGGPIGHQISIIALAN